MMICKEKRHIHREDSKWSRHTNMCWHQFSSSKHRRALLADWYEDRVDTQSIVLALSHLFGVLNMHEVWTGCILWGRGMAACQDMQATLQKGKRPHWQTTKHGLCAVRSGSGGLHLCGQANTHSCYGSKALCGWSTMSRRSPGICVHFPRTQCDKEGAETWGKAIHSPSWVMLEVVSASAEHWGRTL